MFKKTAAEPKTMASRNPSGATFSILGLDTAIKGDIVASADLHIDGRVEGDISCTALVQGQDSTIIGAITADSARLAGTVSGTIDTKDLVILKSARITGDIQYDSLTIEQGAQVDGRLSPRGAASVAGTTGEAHLILASANS